jgi:hypothetical protein
MDRLDRPDSMDRMDFRSMRQGGSHEDDDHPFNGIIELRPEPCISFARPVLPFVHSPPHALSLSPSLPLFIDSSIDTLEICLLVQVRRRGTVPLVNLQSESESVFLIGSPRLTHCHCLSFGYMCFVPSIKQIDRSSKEVPVFPWCFSVFTSRFVEGRCAAPLTRLDHQPPHRPIYSHRACCSGDTFAADWRT